MKKRGVGNKSKSVKNKSAGRNVSRGRNNPEKVEHKPYMLLVFLLFVFAVAFIGNLFVGDGVNSEWYQSVRSDLAPPSWAFGIVWVILYFLIAVSLYIAWINVKTKKDERNLFIIYGVNLVANGLWTYLFFSLKNPLLVFADIILIWLTIICMIVCTWKISRKASLLLIPYFLWVTFAGVLNFISYLKSI
ncbi:hypothetical protein CO038_02905 [Candidatus Pacearchaeota archaeon CG_4_9_14_0_2_um_filter_39_13]|nr:tryptophan-rich sensory protein [Candidatus Pacearchaeota archaeon]PJC44607.1 MAG: hypothetical protein CO038_02905 [Candidatus Pacearchaeota archaeon CG_4_9_14_0_2_um_filter_39_13]